MENQIFFCWNSDFRYGQNLQFAQEIDKEGKPNSIGWWLYVVIAHIHNLVSIVNPKKAILLRYIQLECKSLGTDSYQEVERTDYFRNGLTNRRSLFILIITNDYISIYNCIRLKYSNQKYDYIMDEALTS